MPPTSKRNWALGYDMWCRGEPQAEIAAALRCTRAAVRQWAVRHGWPERSHERRTIVHAPAAPKPGSVLNAPETP